MNADLLTGGSNILLFLVFAAWAVFMYLKASKEERREFVEDLVRRAQQEMQGAAGEEKRAFVIAEFKKRWPGFPTDTLLTFLEAAVNRVKAEEPQAFEFEPPIFK